MGADGCENRYVLSSSCTGMPACSNACAAASAICGAPGAGGATTTLAEIEAKKRKGVPPWVFAVIAVPWYAYAIAVHGQAFIDGFIMKHNVGRFSSTMLMG